MEVLSICLTDIPKEHIKLAKNGKKYLNIVVSPRKEKDRYGQDLTVFVQQSKEARQNRADKQYIGNGKTYEFDNSGVHIEEVENMPVAEDNDDLPF
jgi:hypothetical protein